MGQTNRNSKIGCATRVESKKVKYPQTLLLKVHYETSVPRAGDRLMLFDVKSRTWTELAKIGLGYPEWSRQGDYIYFLGVLPGGTPGGIFRVRISDRKLEQVVTLKDFRQAPYWGSWGGLAPDDSPLLLRDAGTEDIYALDWQAP